MSDPANPSRSKSQMLGQTLVDRARSIGFACAGISGIEPSERRDALMEWIGASMHGSMGWMEHHTELRADPGRLIENARSILVVGDLYASREDNTDHGLPPGRARIARYARGRDYHTNMKKRLKGLADELEREHPDASFKVFVDTAPVPERELAQRAGIGWVAKHTLVIHPRLGSYLFLGGIVTTLDAGAPARQPVVTDHCGSCTRCIQACPTQAITPYRVDARRCISYLTIEHREEIEPGLAGKMGDWIYGCDICQEVCPHNSPRRVEGGINSAYEPERDSFDLLAVLGWDEEARRAAFVSSAMKRARLGMMRRNAAIVAANQIIADPDSPISLRLKEMLGKLAADESAEPLARGAAADALERLDP